MNAPLRTFWLFGLFKAQTLTAAGAIWLLIVLFCALTAPFIAPYNPLEINPIARLTEPNATHLFGTDHFGRDTLSRCIHGARMALLIGFGVVAVSLSLGGVIGMLSAYFTRLGNLLMRAVDVFMAFPALLLALALMTLLDRSVFNTIVVIGIVYTTTTARILFGIVLKLKNEAFISAAICSGIGHARILLRHILPNLASPLLVQASFIFAFAQLQAAALDFLGLGLPPEIPSWGNMLSESRIYITRAPWLLLYPGLGIIFSVFAMNLVGDAVRDRLDPRFKDDLAKL